MEGDATWTLAFLILLPILVLMIAGLLIFAVAVRRASDPAAAMFSWAALGCAAVLALGTAAGFYPWKAEYHQYVVKQGTVSKIDKRIIGGDSVEEKFVAQFTDGRQFGCEDTRCANVRPGDQLVLACKRTWQYAGTDGYDCAFRSYTPKA